MRLLSLIALGACGGGASDPASPSTPSPETTPPPSTHGPYTSEPGDTGTPVTTDSDTGLPIDTGPTGCTVTVTDVEDFPTVRAFDFETPVGATSVVLSIDDGARVQTWSRGTDPGPTEVLLPLDPSITAAWTLTVETAGGSCADTGTVETGAWDGGALTSTGDGSHTDRFVLPVHEDGSPDRVVLYGADGAVIWRYAHGLNLRSVELAADGSGVWLLDTQDGFAGGFDPDATQALQLVDWRGEIIASHDVAAGHHDWQLGDGALGDASTVYLMGRQHWTSLEALCGSEIWGDTVFTVGVDDGAVETLYSTVDDGFPTPVGCDGLGGGIPSGDGIAYSYFNGLQRYGDTVGVSVSGLVHGLLLGAADGSWHFLTDDRMSSDLAIVSRPGLHPRLVQAPHSVVCTEGIDWGAGVGDDPDVLTCVAYHRRGFGDDRICDTADVFRARLDTGEAEYLATFPPPGFVGDRWAGCSSTNHHGNAGLIGAPNAAGDGVTRIAMYAAATGAITVVDLTMDASGASFSLDYVVAPEVSGQVSGWFATPLAQLGVGHTP